MSGARDDRPGLAALMAYVRAGDAVVVWKLEAGPQHAAHPADRQGVDRPGRDAGFHYGRHRLVHPRRSHDVGILGVIGEYERELVKERTAVKRASSRANGTKFGRPRKVDDTEHIATAKRMKADGHTGRDIAKYLGVSRATLYRYLDDSGAA